MRALGRYRFTLLFVGWSLACGAPVPEEPPPPTTGPLNSATYARRLGQAAGGLVAVDRVLDRARSAGELIDREMGRLAREIGEPDGWRPLFERLQRQAPADEAAVLDAYRVELGRAADWVRGRGLVSLPAAEPELLVLENRSLRAHFPLALYHDGRFAVTTAPAVGDDPGYLGNHCWVCIPPLAVHEGYPGHHVAFARMRNAAGEAPQVAQLVRHKPFVEGWGLYAEVLMLESGYYESAERRLAAWRMILLRLARAELDVQLHGGGLEPAAAEEIYRQRLLLTPAAAAAEVRTHLAKPTVKASYFVGLLQILELREALRARGSELSEREFHDRLLGPPAPIPRISRERFEIELGPAGEVDLAWPRPLERR